jgi:hypothetical protein
VSSTRVLSVIALLAVAVLPFTPAAAHPLGIAISYEDVHFPLDVGGSSYETHLSEINLDLRDHLGRYVLVGLHGGYIGVTQDTNPAFSGLDVSGYDVGVSATGVVPLTSFFGVTLSAADTYHDASASVPDGHNRLHWYDAGGRLGVWLADGHFRVSAGGYVRHLEGNELLAPPHAATVSIAGRTRAGPYGGISYVTSEGGRIALFVEGGRWHGATLSFRYGF